MIIVRIARDLAAHPTSHSLFPFEIAIAGYVGTVTSSFGGVVPGRVTRWFAK